MNDKTSWPRQSDDDDGDILFNTNGTDSDAVVFIQHSEVPDKQVRISFRTDDRRRLKTERIGDDLAILDADTGTILTQIPWPELVAVKLVVTDIGDDFQYVEVKPTS
jgi:hypothetical protein